MKKDIQYISHHHIDKTRWDNCIQQAPNGLLYATAAYLNFMSPGWDALVMGDYEIVMPLTFRKKWGIAYLYQPAFCQQLGVFGKTSKEESIIEAFLEKAKDHFPFIEINFNHGNAHTKFIQKCNLILNLQKPFSEIEKHFRKDLIQKSLKHDLVYSAHATIAETLELYRKNVLLRNKSLKHINLAAFQKLCLHLESINQCQARKVLSQNGTIVSAALLFKDSRRIYYVLSASTPEGRDTDANAFLLYHIIKENAGEELIFDFEGSEISGIQFFFKKFFPEEEPYYFARINHLSPLKKWMKTVYDKLKS